jgi:hypothetical protein
LRDKCLNMEVFLDLADTRWKLDKWRSDYNQQRPHSALADRTLHLLHLLAKHDRIRIPRSKEDLQLKLIRSLPHGNEFASYIDALGEIDGQRYLIDWKTTTSRYPQEPEGLLSLDPQLICYSWMSGIREVALVVFVRKHLPEKHLTRIPKKQLREMGWTKARELVKVARREGSEFDCAPWVHKARELPKEEFRREVERHLTGRDTEPWELVYFKLYKSQLPVVDQALETAALMLGTNKSRGYCLEMICADFLAGANLESGNQESLIGSVCRIAALLPTEIKQELMARLK